jgi:hypothetical protein
MVFSSASSNNNNSDFSPPSLELAFLFLVLETTCCRHILLIIGYDKVFDRSDDISFVRAHFSQIHKSLEKKDQDYQKVGELLLMNTNTSRLDSIVAMLFPEPKILNIKNFEFCFSVDVHCKVAWYD